MALPNKMLMAAYYFPPLGGGGVQRTVKFAKYLSRLGWDISILTCQKGSHNIKIQDFEEDISKMQIYRVREFPLLEALQNYAKLYEAKPALYRLAIAFQALICIFLIPDSKILWIIPVLLHLIKMKPGKQWPVVYTTGPDHSQHLIGLALKHFCKINWIADFRDPWTTRVSYRPYTRFHKLIDTWLERLVISKANNIIVATDTWKKEFISRFAFRYETAFNTIYNGYDPEDFNNFKAKPPSQFVLIHLGSLYARQDPKPFLNAMSQLNKRGQISKRIHVILAGAITEDIKQEIKKLKLESSVEIRDYMQHHKALELTQKASALLLIVGGGENAQGICPGKVGEYIRTGLPILYCGPEGEVTRILRRIPGCRIAPERDVAMIEKGLLALMQNCPAPDLKKIPADILDMFNRQHQAELLSNICSTADVDNAAE